MGCICTRPKAADTRLETTSSPAPGAELSEAPASNSCRMDRMDPGRESPVTPPGTPPALPRPLGQAGTRQPPARRPTCDATALMMARPDIGMLPKPAASHDSATLHMLSPGAALPGADAAPADLAPPIRDPIVAAALRAPPSRLLDDLARVAALVFEVAAAGVALIGAEGHLRLHAVAGPAADTVTEPRSPSHESLLVALLRSLPRLQVLVVPDLSQDPRFREGPQVAGPPFLRYLAAAPLVASGSQTLGGLLLADTVPHTLDCGQANLLVNLADLVTRELERAGRQALEAATSGPGTSAGPDQQPPSLQRALDAADNGVALCRLSADGSCQVLYANDSWSEVTGMPGEELQDRNLWERFQVPGLLQENLHDLGRIAHTKKVGFAIGGVRSETKQGGGRLQVRFRRAGSERVYAAMPQLGIPAHVSPGADATSAFYFAVAVDDRDAGSDDEPITQLRTGQQGRSPFPDVQLEPLLGYGSFGRVYRGILQGPQGSRPVAVKVVETARLGPLSAAAAARDQAEAEAALAAGLHHPHLVQTLRYMSRPARTPSNWSSADSSSDDDGDVTAAGSVHWEVWMLQVFCDGGSLRDALDRGCLRNSNGVADMAGLVATAGEVAAALSYLHAHGILHGDLSGNNVLLTSCPADSRGFIARVSDFGRSRLVGGHSYVDTSNYGTVTHMPPELLAAGRLTPACDVYAFGVLLWELYTGKRPWAGLHPAQVVYQVGSRKQRLSLPPSVPAPLQELYLRCTDLEPAARPAVQEVQLLLQQLLPAPVPTHVAGSQAKSRRV